MEEEWRDIKGYEGKYQVSNTGKVKSLNYKRTGQAKLLRPSSNEKRGYSSVTLLKDGKQKTKLVYRLIAEAFIPNPNNYPVINHINRNRNR